MKIKVIIYLSFLILFVYSANGQKRENNINADLCVIKLNPEAILEKTLDVRAVYTVGFEQGWLDGIGSCLPRQINRIAYRFNENYERVTERKVLRRFNKILRKKAKKNRLMCEKFRAPSGFRS